MEVMLKRPVDVKEERRVDCVGDEEEGREIGKFGSEMSLMRDKDSSNPSSPNKMDSSINKQIPTTIASERSLMATTSRPSSSNPMNSISQEDQLESTKAEMGEVREENERLKMFLARIVRDYQSLQKHFFDIVQQEQAKKPIETSSIHHDVEESELVSLSLGTNSSGHKKEENINTSTSKIKESHQNKGGLTLGLDCKFEGSCSGAIEPASNLSPEDSFEEPKEEEAGEPWPPSKILKTLRNVDDEVSQQTHVKKARVSVRARCDAPTMNDGCQWRKYGQKIAKGNPCPRAYYRCTVAPACPVRKQVQRCAEDTSILITTYEGSHNHPLSISATAMASTTSAAASMLMSGSTISRPSIGSSPSTTTAAANASLHGLNFGFSDNSRPSQFYLPNPSMSSSPSHPTITLDLTAPPSSSSSSQFNRFSSNFTSTPRYPSTSFNFSTSESNTLPTSWSNGYNLSYGAQPYNRSQVGSLSSTLGRQSQDPLYQSYLQKTTNPVLSMPSQHSLTDTIAKAITSDPSFQSALAVAITSYVGKNGAQGTSAGDGLGINSMKWGEQFGAVNPYTSTPNGNTCASSYLTRTTSSSNNLQQGSMMFLQPSMAFSSSKSASASPV